MVQFLPLDVTDEDSVGVVLSHIDNAIQYGENEEPKEPKDVCCCSLSACFCADDGGMAFDTDG